jgi:hypothetical protein
MGGQCFTLHICNANTQQPLAIERRADLIIGRKDPDSKQIVHIGLAPSAEQFDACQHSYTLAFRRCSCCLRHP